MVMLEPSRPLSCHHRAPPASPTAGPLHARCASWTAPAPGSAPAPRGLRVPAVPTPGSELQELRDSVWNPAALHRPQHPAPQPPSTAAPPALRPPPAFSGTGATGRPPPREAPNYCERQAASPKVAVDRQEDRVLGQVATLITWGPLARLRQGQRVPTRAPRRTASSGALGSPGVNLPGAGPP